MGEHTYSRKEVKDIAREAYEAGAKRRGSIGAWTTLIEEEVMMSEFTPGPWVFMAGRQDGAAEIYGPGPNGEVLAGVRRIADARLIAAAPALYEFVRNIATTLEDPRFPPDASVWDIIQDDASALIAKARGETT